MTNEELALRLARRILEWAEREAVRMGMTEEEVLRRAGVAFEEEDARLKDFIGKLEGE